MNKGWRKVKFGDILELKYGKGLTKSKRKPGKFPVFGSSGQVGTHNEFLVNGPGLIVGRKGNVGSVFYSEKSFFPIDTVYYVDENREEFNLRFMYYLMKGTKSLKHNGDAAVPGLNREYALSREIFLPIRLNDQQKIATILSNYDDLIENNLRRIELLENMAKLIYDEWFVKFKFPGHSRVKMIDSGLGKIPEGWEVRRLEDSCSLVTDGTHEAIKATESGFHMISAKNIGKGFIDFSSAGFISKEDHDKVISRSKPELNDILFSKIGTIGNIAVVKNNFEFSIKNVALFKPLSIELTNYLFLIFSNEKFLENFTKRASGTSQKFVSLTALRNTKILVPERSILQRFNSYIHNLLEHRHKLNQKNKNLEKTRDLLLPKLINGEIDVSELDIEIKAAEV